MVPEALRSISLEAKSPQPDLDPLCNRHTLPVRPRERVAGLKPAEPRAVPKLDTVVLPRLALRFLDLRFQPIIAISGISLVEIRPPSACL